MIALIIGGTWLGGQRHLISTLEKESASLLTQIAARSSGVATLSAPGSPSALGKEAQENEPINWKKLAAKIKAVQGENDLANMRMMLRMQLRIQKMSKQEILAALDEIAALDLSREDQDRLEGMLLGPLISKDPELALTRFIDRANESMSSVNWQLRNALGEWAKKDPSQAVAWMDAQIAAGQFNSKSLDGKCAMRIQFEGELIGILLGSEGVAAAGHRLAGMPADQRSEVLDHSSLQQLKEDGQIPFATMVRDELPPQDQGSALAKKASKMVSADGFTKVTEFLDRIQATPAERSACAEQAAESQIHVLSRAREIASQDLDAMRVWVSSQAPELIDKITVEALSSAVRGEHPIDFAEAGQLAQQYGQASGSEDVLTKFLQSPASYHNREQARALAEKITDLTLREQILSNLK